MQKKLVYMPTFRVRQEESKVLKSFDFGDKIYPLLEVVKEYDRHRSANQKTFEEIHVELIDNINSEKVFVDLPLYISNTNRSLKPEILEFTLSVINNRSIRTDYLKTLSSLSGKIIPVISSYRNLNYSDSFLAEQYEELNKLYPTIAIRLKHSEFQEEWEIIKNLVKPSDYIIIDINKISSQPDGPALRDMVNELTIFKKCHKIILRSALNNEIQNKTLDHDQIIYEADNAILESYRKYGVDSVGDYAGVKKDYMTNGGAISPGFIYFDAVTNQYFGYTYTVRELANFKDHIVPSVLRSEATRRMTDDEIDFLGSDNFGWRILNRVHDGLESGKNQAKFKRVSMEHYLYTVKKLIEFDLI